MTVEMPHSHPRWLGSERNRSVRRIASSRDEKPLARVDSLMVENGQVTAVGAIDYDTREGPTSLHERRRSLAEAALEQPRRRDRKRENYGVAPATAATGRVCHRD